MEIVYLLVPMSVVLVFLIVVAFWWSVHAGQFDDLDRHGRTVIDDIDTVAVEGGASAGDAAASSDDPAGPPVAAPPAAGTVVSRHAGPPA